MVVIGFFKMTSKGILPCRMRAVAIIKTVPNRCFLHPSLHGSPCGLFCFHYVYSCDHVTNTAYPHHPPRTKSKMPRFHCPLPMSIGEYIDLPASAIRHIQVLRLQPNDTVTLFQGNKNTGEFVAQIIKMGRNSVNVQILAHHAIEKESNTSVHLLVCMPANDRMDWLVEKATELGVASITPLSSQRSVLRLVGDSERAEKNLNIGKPLQFLLVNNLVATKCQSCTPAKRCSNT